MDACAGGLTGGVEAGDSGAPVEIGFDPTHEVVRRGQNGYEIAREIERMLREEGADAGETLVEIDVADMPHIEECGLDCAVFAERLAGDGAGNNVAWSEFEEWMIALHEALSACVAQVGAFTAEGFAHEEARRSFERERGGMELIELHVSEVGTGL